MAAMLHSIYQHLIISGAKSGVFFVVVVVLFCFVLFCFVVVFFCFFWGGGGGGVVGNGEEGDMCKRGGNTSTVMLGGWCGCSCST